MKPVKLGPFINGVNNRAEDISLVDKDGKNGERFLRAAVNVDITDAGKVVRRRGLTLTAHTLRTDPPISLPISATHAVASASIISNDGLRDTMNAQPRDLSCKHFGRYVAAFQDTLYWSDLYLDGDELGNGAKTTADRNFMPLPANITAVFSTGMGLYVSADQTYFLPGDVQSSKLDPVHPSTILKGSVSAAPLSNTFAWLSTRGVMTGSQSGEVTFLSNKHVDTGFLKPNLTGATVYRSSQGIRQVIAILHGEAVGAGAQSADYMDAEIIRKGENYGH